MARARLIVVSSQRLDRLDALLVAAGAEKRHVVRVDDPFDLFEVETAEESVLVLDLDGMPEADAGLLRRWCERNPGARLVWIGGDADQAAAFERAGVTGDRLRWPLDLVDLGLLAGSPGAPAVPPEIQPIEGPAETDDAPPPPRTEHRNGAGGATDLSRIEAILGRAHDEQEAAESPAASEPAESTEPGLQDEAGAPPRVAFLAAPPVPVRSEASSAPPAVPPAAVPPAAVPPAAVPPAAVPPAAVPPGERIPQCTPETGVESEPALADELDLPPGPGGLLGGNEPLLTKEEIDAFFVPLDEVQREPITHEPTEGDDSAHAGDIASQRPRWLKDQTADLADIVQGLDLRARANHSHVGLESELARLRQFTKTIGFVAAPPPPGSQDFDLATLVEEQLGELAGDSPDAPRLLFRRSQEGTTIQADKMLVAMALEALLRTAIGCAGAGDVVRVSVDARVDAGPLARIEFPAGPLHDLRPEEVLEPYALKSRLPQIGSNALAAAGGIAVGHGGDLVVAEASPATRAFEVSFSSGSSPQ